MNLIGGIGNARRQLFQWFGGLALSAKAGIATAAFVTMSAGVVIGVPYTPSSAPWFVPQVAPYETLQTPSALNASMVVAAMPTDASSSGTGVGTNRPSVTNTSSAQQPTGVATPSAEVATSSRTPTTMAPATTTATKSKTTSAATTGVQTSASAYYKNCAQASKSGAAPITSGQPGYRTELDLNHNGVACE